MKISLLNIADINIQSQDIQSIEQYRTLKKYSPFREDNPSFPKSLARSGRHSGEVNGPAPTNSRGRRRPPRKASMIPLFSCSISRLGNSSKLDCTRLNEMVHFHAPFLVSAIRVNSIALGLTKWFRFSEQARAGSGYGTEPTMPEPADTPPLRPDERLLHTQKTPHCPPPSATAVNISSVRIGRKQDHPPKYPDEVSYRQSCTPYDVGRSERPTNEP